MIREKWSWHDQQYFEGDFWFYRDLWHSYMYDEEISDVINKTVRQRIRTVLGFVESCDTHVTVTAAWWTPVIHHALDAWFRHTARVTLAMDTAFVTDVLHCLCYERVTLLVWQTCYAACVVLRTLMWCSRTCGPCNSLMPFSWSQNSTENTKTNTLEPFSTNQSTSSTTHCNCLMYWCLRWSGDRKPTDWWSRVEHFVRLL